jgi:aryl-alcohol dehydrogenase-like predicted oxidoreductase
VRYVEAGGARVSVIGLGTWQFGSREWGYGDTYARSEAVAITRRALDLGVTLVDTAEIYGFGRSEKILAGPLTGRRDEAFLASKLFPVLPVPPVARMRAAASIRRLGVEHLDLYQLHAPNPAIPLALSMRAMRQVRDRGLTRHIGVSNCTLAQWQRADRGLGAPVLSNQVRYSLAVRGPERDLLPWAQGNDRLLIAYSPLAQGLLSGAYDGANTPKDVRRGNPLFQPESIVSARELLDCLRQVAGELDATPAQVALAWLVRRPNVVAIPGARTVAQLEANVAAAELVLTDEQDRALTAASDTFRPPMGTAKVRRVPALRRRRVARR